MLKEGKVSAIHKRCIERIYGHEFDKVWDPPPTTWTIFQQDGPSHLGLRYNALPEHQMARITSDCARPCARPPGGVTVLVFVLAVLLVVLVGVVLLPLPSPLLLLDPARFFLLQERNARTLRNASAIGTAGRPAAEGGAGGLRDHDEGAQELPGPRFQQDIPAGVWASHGF